ncbi:MAG: translocation/assembly module TamB domain-containing protein [Paracoccaceae bacterium]
MLRRLTLCAVLLAPLPALAQEEDEGILTRFIQDQLSGAGRTVDVQGFAGALSSEASVERLVIEDAEGPWLIADGLLLDWNRSAVLRGRIEVEELSAQRIQILRAPLPGEAAIDVPDARATPFSLPELPVSIDLGRLAIDRVELGESFVGEPVTLSVDGSARLAGGEGAADLTAQRLDATEGLFALDASYSNATRQLSVALTLEEGPGGLAVGALGIPGAPSVALSIDGEGPIDGFAADIGLSTDGTERIGGRFEISDGGPGVTRRIGLDLSGDISVLLSGDAAGFVGDSAGVTVTVVQAEDGSTRLEALDLTAAALTLSGTAEIGPDGWPRAFDLQGAVAEGDGRVDIPGAEGLSVAGAEIDLSYDAARGEAWTGLVTATGVRRADLAIDRLAIEGGGVISRGAGEATADLTYGAEGLAFEDQGLSDALGTDVTGRLVAARDGSDAIDIPTFTLRSAGLDVTAEARIALDGEPRVTLDTTVAAGDLSRFAGVSGQPLAGAGTVTAAGPLRPLSGIFDLYVALDATDLAIGQDRLDPLLIGRTQLTAGLRRDETGTYIEDLTLDGTALSGQIDAALTGDDIDATLDLSIDDLARVLDSVTGPARLSGDVAQRAGGTIALDVALTAPDLDLTVAGTVEQPRDAQGDVTDTPLDLRIEGRIDAIGPYAAAFGQDVAGAARIDGTVAASPGARSFDVDVALSTDGLSTPDDRLDALLGGAGSLSLTARGALDGTVEVERLVLDYPAIDGRIAATVDLSGETPDPRSADLDVTVADASLLSDALSGPLSLSGTVRPEAGSVRRVDLAASGPGLDVAIDGTVDPAAPALDVALTFDVADLSDYAELAGRPIAGRLQGSADAVADLSARTFDVEADVTSTGLATGVDQIDRLVAGEGSLSVAAAGDLDGDIALERLALSYPNLSGTASGRANTTERSFDIDADLSTDGLETGISQVDALIGGDGGVVLRAAGDLDGDIAVERLVLSYPNLSGAASGTVNAAERSFDVTADLFTDGLVTGIAQVDGLIGGDGGLRVDAEGALDGTVTVRDLAVDYPGLSGSARGSVDLSGPAPVPGEVEADLSIADLSVLVAGLSGPGTLRADVGAETGGGRAVVAEVTAPALTAAIDGTITGTQAFSGRFDVGASNLRTYAGLVGQPISGAVDADGQAQVDLSTGRFDVTAQASTTNLSVGNAQADGLLAGTGTVTVSAAGAIDGPVTLRDLSARYPGVSLDASGSADLAGGLSDAQARFDARLTDLGRFVPDLPGPATMSGTARQTPAGFAVDVDGTGPQGIAFSADGTVGGTLNVDGSVPLGLANPFIEPRRIDGTATLDLTVQGPPSLQAVSGTISTSGARLTAPMLGLALNDLSGTVRLADAAATLDLRAAPADGGALSVGGRVGLTGDLPADITVRADEVVLRDPSLYETSATGSVTVTGPLRGTGARARIAGDLALGQTEIQVPTSGVGGLGDLPPVTHLNAPAAVRRTLERADLSVTAEREAAATGAPARGFPLDLTVRAPGRVFIRGRGLDAELGGALRLAGTTTDIVPQGRFELIRGRIDILNQRFDLTEGTASLQGDFVPVIRLVARTQTEAGTTVSVVVEGPATAPEIGFESSSGLPEDEVIAQLLFGRSLSAISPLQAVQLASAIGTLTGRGGGVLETFRESIGVDDLDITTDEEGNAAVTAGAYISENVYTDVTVDSTGETRIDLNIDITDDITARGSVGSDGETSIGIFFERDY